jgi:hypothetical protein
VQGQGRGGVGQKVEQQLVRAIKHSNDVLGLAPVEAAAFCLGAPQCITHWT